MPRLYVAALVALAMTPTERPGVREGRGVPGGVRQIDTNRYISRISRYARSIESAVNSTV